MEFRAVASVWPGFASKFHGRSRPRAVVCQNMRSTEEGTDLSKHERRPTLEHVIKADPKASEVGLLGRVVFLSWP